jgi:hypothetical protein
VHDHVASISLSHPFYDKLTFDHLFIYCGDLVCNGVLPPLVSQATRDQKVAVTVIGHYIKYNIDCHMIILVIVIPFPMTLLMNMFASTIMDD